MNDYKSYMDRVTVSDALHEKLLRLEEPARKPVRWQRYAAIAACAALLLGVGVWGMSREDAEAWKKHVASFTPYASAEPEPVQCAAPSAPSTSEAIELAPEDPNGAEPGMKTIEGYEVRVNRAGVDLVEYHILPWIDYGTESSAASAKLDWDIPQNAVRRNLSTDEIGIFLGGADAVVHHLDWSAYELSGWGAWYEDGSFWGAYLQGYKGPMDHFEFAVTAGALPPTCVVFGGSVEQEVWGLSVTADKYDGKDGCSRRVSFMKDDYGYRFDLTATGEPEAAEKLVSRAVTWIANGDGLDFAPFTGEETPEPGWDSESQPPSPPSQNETSSQHWVAAPSVPPAVPVPGNPDTD